MKDYRAYIDGVLDGSIVASKFIKQAVKRLEDLKAREDIYFDEDAVSECFEFIACMKEWSGKAAGKSGALLPFQKWIVGSIIGIKWKETNTRVCTEAFCLMARKNAKTSLISKLCAYLMICDGESNPFIGCVATSTQNARILFEAACNYLKTIDPKQTNIKLYHNYIKFKANNGEFHVFSSDAKTIEGYNFSSAVADEVHTYKDNSLLSVLRASMGARKQPILFQISTCGTLLDGYPCYETYKMSLEILAGIKEDPTFFPFIYMMDADDDWQDEDNWIKCNPSLDVIVSRDYLKQQVQLATNDTTQRTLIKIKNFNCWENSIQTWIPAEKIARCMKNWNLEDFAGQVCYVGVDLASVQDLSAVSVLVLQDDKYYFKNWSFLPRETFLNSPNHSLYQQFYERGDLIISEGNVTDFQLITNKIIEISQILTIQGVYYDMFNATQFCIECTNLGLPMIPFKQGLQSFNGPTKEMERIILTEKAIFDKSTMMLWEFSNVVLRIDHASNIKPDKASVGNKIDNVISSIEALGGYLQNPIGNDFELFVL